jgi:hypothetical protein
MDPVIGGHGSHQMRSPLAALALCAITACDAAPSAIRGPDGSDASIRIRDGSADSSEDADAARSTDDAEGGCAEPLPAVCVPGATCAADCNGCYCSDAGEWGCTQKVCPGP